MLDILDSEEEVVVVLYHPQERFPDGFHVTKLGKLSSMSFRA